MLSINQFLAQGDTIKTLKKQIKEGYLSHALLIKGEEGIGKWSLALAITAALLCEAPEDDLEPCGKCRACQQIASLSHPDLTVLKKGEPLAPTNVKTVIPVSDVQEMIRRIGKRGYQSERHIVIIRHAEDMDVQAQNNILKTLEDPPEDVYFFLTSIHTEKILPTIISRCRILMVHPWKYEEILASLKSEGLSGPRAEAAAFEAGGSFGKAFRIARDSDYWEFRSEVIHDFLECRERSQISEIGIKWKDRKEDADALFSILESFFSNILHIKYDKSCTRIKTEDIPQKWLTFAHHSEMSRILELKEKVTYSRRQIAFSINFQAVVEQLLLSFLEALDSCST